MPDTRTDEQLVELARAGDAGAFRELYDRFYPRAYRLAFGMAGSHDLAQDLTQEIFVRVYQKLDRYQQRSSFATWFYRLAINSSLNSRKRYAWNPREWSEDAGMPNLSVAAGTVEGAVLRAQVQEQIGRALQRLKPESRLIVILKDVEGLSIAEIAERLDCSPGTVASRLFRARDNLARRLGHLRDTLE